MKRRIDGHREAQRKTATEKDTSESAVMIQEGVRSDDRVGRGEEPAVRRTAYQA